MPPFPSETYFKGKKCPHFKSTYFRHVILIRIDFIIDSIYNEITGDILIQLNCIFFFLILLFISFSLTCLLNLKDKKRFNHD